jgi:cytochrome b6-f complex iron-sulfur subunit
MTDAGNDTQANETPRLSVFASRRRFIQLGMVTAVAAWVGTFVQSRLFPRATTQEAKPVTFPVSELPVGGAKYVTYGGVPTIVIRSPESIKAYSLVCTHLGCIVEWQQDAQEFYCACHDGRFDRFGEVIAGPPPVPLEQFPVSVEDETLVVGEVV